MNCISVRDNAIICEKWTRLSAHPKKDMIQRTNVFKRMKTLTIKKNYRKNVKLHWI